MLGNSTYLSVEYFVDGSDVNGKPRNLSRNLCFNAQTSHGFENFYLFSSNSTDSVQNQVIYFQHIYNCVFSLLLTLIKKKPAQIIFSA